MNEYNFKSSEILFSRIKEDLSSYDSVGLIDEGKFYQYIKYIVDTLGISFYEEKDAVVHVHDYKASLPPDFTLLEIAFKCHPLEGEFQTSPPPSLQWQFKGWNDMLEKQSQANECAINCDWQGEDPKQVFVRMYIEEVPVYASYNDIQILRVSPNVSKDRCRSNCRNRFASHSPFEITIDDRYIYTNFPHDAIYMKYYAFPTDDDGLPMVPDNAVIEDCIEYYIKFKLFEQMHMNGDDANIEKKLMYFREMWDIKLKEAKNYAKMPRFDTMVHAIRQNRRKYNIYQLNVMPLRRAY